MGSSMHAWASGRRPRAWLAGLLLAAAAGAAEPGLFRITEADTRLADGVFLLSARIDYRLSPEALEALDSGVPLFVVLDIRVERQRRWWWNSTVARLQQRYLLLYHALSEKYVVHSLNSGAQANYRSLAEALAALGRIEDLPLMDSNLLESGADYRVRMRAYLDIEALPAPLQPLAYLSPGWRLQSEWRQWSLRP